MRHDLCHSNAWYHVASTAANNGQLKIYVNGVEEASVSGLGSLTTTGGYYSIGSGNQARSAFAGVMDDARLYTSALSASDIQRLASGGASAPSANRNTWTDFLSDIAQFVDDLFAPPLP